MPKSYGALLVQIRDELGMTQKDLAVALGISESSCAQYMAGAHGMPKDIWEEAVELKEQGAPRHRRLRELFDGHSIKQILARWMSDVKRASPELKVTYIEISRIMAVNKSTVTRWARDEQRPTLARLGELEDTLQRWIAKQKLSVKQRAGGR
jgi:transcriptional regulator with XRE-family HTH domain